MCCVALLADKQRNRAVSSDRRDITASIERLETIEHRLGVTLGGLSAFLVRYDHGDGEVKNVVYAYGELYAEIGSDPKRWLLVHIEAYDRAGTMVARSHEQIRADKFLGFDTFDFELSVPVGSIAKMRIYPDIEDPKYRY